MLWYLPLVLLIFSTVAQSLWQRNYAQNSILPDTFPPALSYIFALMPIGFLAGIVIPHHVEWSGWLMLLLLVEGIFIALFNWLMFVALRNMPIVKFQMIIQLYAVVVIVLGWSLLGEKLTLLQIIGGIFLAVAAYIAIQAPKSSQRELKRHANKKAVIITVCAALALGIGLVTEKAALQYMDVGAYFIFGFATQTIALVVLAAKDVTKKNLTNIKTSDMRQVITMGTMSAIVGLSYLAAIKLSDNISLVTVLGAFSLPLTVLAAFYFLHERENMKKMWLATFLGLIGLIIVAL